MTPRRRAVLYARVSTRDQHVDLQLDELRRAAEQRGWEVVAELHDVASGARADLAGRAQALQLVERAEAGLIAVWRLDRLGRSVRDLVEAVDRIRAAGAQLVSLRDSIDTGTPAGRMAMHVLAAAAELERELIRERVVAGIAAARRRGRRLGRPREHVDVGRARLLRAKGVSWRAIARELGASPRTVRRRLEEAREAVAKSRARHGTDPVAVAGAGGRSDGEGAK